MCVYVCVRAHLCVQGHVIVLGVDGVAKPTKGHTKMKLISWKEAFIVQTLPGVFQEAAFAVHTRPLGGFTVWLTLLQLFNIVSF